MSTSKTIKALAAGAVGACVLNILHESSRKLWRGAPRMDILGMRALARGVRALGGEPPSHLRQTALAGDLALNSVFYSLAATAGRDGALLTGTLLGVGAGLGAVLLPIPMGLGAGPSDRTPATQAATIGLYTAAGLATAAVYRALDRD